MPIKQKFITAVGDTMKDAVAELNRSVMRLKVWRVVSFNTTSYVTPDCSTATITALCERKAEPKANKMSVKRRPLRDEWLEPLGSRRRRA